MNQNEIMALCEKVKDCDRDIHVQQLRIDGKPPLIQFSNFKIAVLSAHNLVALKVYRTVRSFSYEIFKARNFQKRVLR
jgi:hypothetical protein